MTRPAPLALVFALALLAAPAAAQVRPPSIAVVRATPPTVPGGTPVIVTALGVVTRAYGRQVFLQDTTAAIVVFSPPTTRLYDAVQSGAVRPGDSLQVTGQLDEFPPVGSPPGTGQLTIGRVTDDGFFLWTRDAPQPPAQQITLAELTAGDPDTDDFEAEIVRIEGLTIDRDGATTFAGGATFVVRQTVGGVETTGALHIDGAVNGSGDCELVGQPIPTGPVDFEGPIDQFHGVNQLLPIRMADLVPSSGTSADPSPQADRRSALTLVPNPVRASGATVHVRLQRTGPVRILLCDVLGRTVAVAFNAVVAAGDQSAWIDTSLLAPGAYVVRLDAAEPVVPARLVVLR